MGIPDSVRRLMRPELAGLEPYDPHFTPCEIALNANENNFGLPESLAGELAEALARVEAHRYPDPLSGRLRDLLSAELGVARERICVGNGGDEIIFNLFLAFGGAGRRVVDLPPSFSVYRIYAEMMGCEVVDVPRDGATLRPDIDAVAEAAATADIVLLCSPNNPTGDLIAREDVARICEACPGIVLLDEAYIDFAPAGSGGLDLLERFERLVILRTFSKAYALAGARCGFCVSSPGIIAAFEAVRQPYSVNSLTQAAAEVAVTRRDAFSPFIQMIVSERARLLDALSRIGGVETFESWANFVLVRIAGASLVRERLRDEHSILVRDVSGTPGAADCLRITVGRPLENDKLVLALKSILEEA